MTRIWFAVSALVLIQFGRGEKLAKLGQFPWAVAVRFEVAAGERLHHACSGGILNMNWVLTSAHCLLSGLERVIVAGIVKPDDDEGDEYCIVRSYRHPMYDMTNVNWHE